MSNRGIANVIRGLEVYDNLDDKFKNILKIEK